MPDWSSEEASVALLEPSVTRTNWVRDASRARHIDGGHDLDSNQHSFVLGAWGFPEWETSMSGTAMQFVRVISRVEDMEIWNASRNGFSFVISYESHSGPGLQARAGFVASWRPIMRTDAPLKSPARPLNPSLRPKKPARRCWDTLLLLHSGPDGGFGSYQV